MNNLLKKLMQKYRNLETNCPHLPIKKLQQDIVQEVKQAIAVGKLKGVDINLASSFIKKVKRAKTIKEAISEIGNFFLVP